LKTPNELATARSRRAFVTMGVAAAAGYGGWTWLRSRSPEGGVQWPLRGVLRGNEKVAETYFSDGHRSPELPLSQVSATARKNGDVGLGADFEPAQWVLNLQGSTSADPQQITLAQIRDLPRVEQITQLNCIEGWTIVVRWVGARFADFTARYAPQSREARYVSMQTPDQAYFVGLDMASALHPQTLLCYEMNGAELTSDHGAPLRLVIPVKYGVKNIKRISKITYTNDRPEDYWANEGYDWYAGL
jgi:DMSO/TMAO reductase YedYZ molybdopterin-dependent catalytic subunit